MRDKNYIPNPDITDINCLFHPFGNDIHAVINIHTYYIWGAIDHGWYIRAESFPFDIKEFTVNNMTIQRYLRANITTKVNTTIDQKITMYLPIHLSGFLERLTIGFSTNNISRQFLDEDDTIEYLAGINCKLIDLQELNTDVINFPLNLRYRSDSNKTNIHVVSYAYGQYNTYFSHLQTIMNYVFGNYINNATFQFTDYDVNLSTITKVYLTLTKNE
jgi:hypothetical protein